MRCVSPGPRDSMSGMYSAPRANMGHVTIYMAAYISSHIYSTIHTPVCYMIVLYSCTSIYLYIYTYIRQYKHGKARWLQASDGHPTPF